jgi:phosphinothricin acetyltransferase
VGSEQPRAGRREQVSLAVRDAAPADLDAIFAIYNEEVLHGTATFDTEPRVRGIDNGWLTDRDPARHPVLVAEDAGVLAGWGSLGPWSARGGYARTAEVSVYVDAGHRRRGVGRVLLAALLERARAAGLGVLIARIAEANEASVRLFEEAGFGHIGTQRRCGEKFGRILDVELLDLHLDGG